MDETGYSSGAGSSKDQTNSSSSSFQSQSGDLRESVGKRNVRKKVRFLKDEDVNGINLVDGPFVQKLKIKLREMRGYYLGLKSELYISFPLSHHRPLSKKNIGHLKKRRYVVAPKPLGVHYLLYVTRSGQVLMQNATKQIFTFHPKRAPQLLPARTILEGFVVRKIVRDAAAEDINQDEAQGKLTFVIMDATLCGGKKLSDWSIRKRIAYVKAKIMVPRENAARNKKEVFDLDIVEYEPLLAARMEQNLSPDFKENYEYPLDSFLFHPRHRCYSTRKRDADPILEWDESANQECSFRLKVTEVEGESKGQLYAIGTNGEEVKYTNIAMTDELRTMNGSIIECRYDDHAETWDFIRVRSDCQEPNTRIYTSGRFSSDFKNPLTRDMLLEVLAEMLPTG